MIYLDDAGYADFSCYGATKIKTPNIDRMAAEGVRFTDFYVCALICTPSRAGLLTGRYHTRMGFANGVVHPQHRIGIPARELTVAEKLRELGYYNGVVGKWHLGTGRRGITGVPAGDVCFLPLQHGFDEYFGVPYSNDNYRANNPRIGPLPLMRGNEIVERFEGEPDPWKLSGFEQTKQRFLTRRFTEEAIGFLGTAKAKGRPFFLYLSHSMPHWPVSRSEAFVGRSTLGKYGDVMEELDWSVGEVLGELKTQGLDRDTLVLLASDNGPWLCKAPECGSAAPLYSGKATTFEGGFRTPFVARVSGSHPARQDRQGPRHQPRHLPYEE